MTKFRLPPDLVDLLYADATTRDGEGAQEEVEDYDGNIAEIPSSPTSVATNATPTHIARFYELFNEKERREILSYHMKASKDKSTGLVATKAGNGNKVVYMATPAAEKTFPDDVEKDWINFRKRLPLEMIKSLCVTVAGTLSLGIIHLIRAFNKVPRNLYYKGSLNGHAARNLLDNNDSINQDLKDLFLKIKKEKDPEKCNYEFIENMNTFFKKMSNLSELMNEIFSMIGSQNQQYNDEQVHDFETMVTNFQILWRELELPLTIKFHHIEDHVVPMMKMHRCLGDYGEESIERLHRIINQKHAQFATTRAWEQRYAKILAEDKLKNYHGVANAIESSKEAKKRKYSSQTQERKDAEQEKLKRIKMERKERVLTQSLTC